MIQQSPAFFDLESVFEKYKTGMSIIMEGARADTGQTPKELIWTKNKARLYRYEPTLPKKYPIPILLVYALINKPYVLDLMPGASLVEYLVNLGFDVYLLDWGTPGDEDSSLTFEHYVLDYITRAAKKVLKASGAQQFTLLGYCMGGTMCAMYAALFPDTLKNLILLTSPIDFSPENMGLYGIWTSPEYIDTGLLADAFGNIPGVLVDSGNKLTRPVANFIGSYVTMWDRILHDKPMDNWLAMSKWVNDGVPFPGAAFHQWIREFYQQNRLVKGTIQLRGRRVDLRQISCPLLNIAGTKDHICTIPQAEAIMSRVSSRDKEFFTIDAGHVGLLTGGAAKKGLWPKIRAWLEARSS
ncbi:MAG: class III poly(R)-hydroxyalkanoic acid synthase subunit PhaC [Ktedonobacteraceae bacterium]